MLPVHESRVFRTGSGELVDFRVFALRCSRPHRRWSFAMNSAKVTVVMFSGSSVTGPQFDCQYVRFDRAGNMISIAITKITNMGLSL